MLAESHLKRKNLQFRRIAKKTNRNRLAFPGIGGCQSSADAVEMLDSQKVTTITFARESSGLGTALVAGMVMQNLKEIFRGSQHKA
jgi:Asp/Glu/hydantoin racemase